MIKATLPLFLILFFNSCCKIQTNFIEINQVYFVNFSISEIDTFYALPYRVDSTIPWMAYQDYRETTQSQRASLNTIKLRYTMPIEIVLKDTSKRYIISSTKSVSKKENNTRCAPVSIHITEFEVNGLVQQGDTIEIRQ